MYWRHSIVIGVIGIFLSLKGFCLQSEDPSIAWYQGFFQEKKRKSVEETLGQATEALKKATETHDPVNEAKALTELGLIHLTRTKDYERSMDFLIRALAFEDSIHLKQEQVFTCMSIARVFEEVGDHYNSARFLQQSLEISQELNNTNLLVLILNELGKINASMGRIQEAFKNYEQVLENRDRVGDPSAEADALFNLGHLYSLQKEFKEALDYHKQALAIRRSIKDKKGEALSLNDVGEMYRLMKNDKKALANHIAALEIRQSLKDKRGIAESYNNIGVLYFEQKNYERAIANFQYALAAGQESQSQDQIRLSYDHMSQCYKALNDFKKALEYRDLFLAITDFIQNEKNELQLLETQNRYVLAKKESQIENLESIRQQREKEIEAQKQFRNFLFQLIGLSIIIVVLIFYLYILIRKSNKNLQVANEKVSHQNTELQELNATKDKFFSIIGHDLKGPLNSLTSFSSLLINHTDSLSKDEIKMLAKDLDKSLKNLFSLLENLLEWSRSQTGNIEFKAELFDLAALLVENQTLLQTQAQNKNITIETLYKEKLTVNAHRHSINTVVRNLVSNAIKFTPKDGKITLSLQRLSKEIKVSVADTGVGMSEEVIKKLFRIDTKHSTKGTSDEKGTGLGLILCKEFVEKNGGTIGVESVEGKGSVFYFTLPA